MDESLVKRVKSFPPLDKTIIKIQEITNKKDSSIKELTDIVNSDPMLTANILKAANSPLYGFSREIKNINQAVSLFGMTTIKGFALISMVQNGIKIDLSPYNLTKGQFLQAALAQNALTFNWYSKVNRNMLDILTSASFLLDIGKIVLAEELKEKKLDKKFSEEIKDRKIAADISQLEEEFLNINSEELTAMILEHWNLEPKLVDSIRYSMELNDANDAILPYCVALNVVKNAVGNDGKLNKEGLQEAYNTIDEYDLDREHFIKALEHLKG